MPKDWSSWPDKYGARPELRERLALVQTQIAACLTACRPGPIQVISLCAGDGRDLLGALPAHPRTDDVSALLVELEHRSVEKGRATAATLGLADRVTFLEGDATWSNHYRGAAPAELVLACGVFGNLDDSELARLICGLPFLCRPEGRLIWTRGLRLERDRPLALIGERLADAGFCEEAVVYTPRQRFAVGRHRYRAGLQALPKDRRFFAFSGPPPRGGSANPDGSASRSRRYPS